jgi:hypothetical protein
MERPKVKKPIQTLQVSLICKVWVMLMQSLIKIYLDIAICKWMKLGYWQ